MTSRTPANRYGEPTFRRTALAPGLLAAIVLLVGFALLDSSAFIVIQYVVSILALIVLWFAIQARQWWWWGPFAAIAVLWNPIFPLDVGGTWWLGAQYVAIIVFVVAGILIKIPVKREEQSGRR